jgi:hypothetical protein
MWTPDLIGFVLFVGAVACFCVGGLLGHVAGSCDERLAAIDAGAAEWRVDPKTGERTFFYFRRS